MVRDELTLRYLTNGAAIAFGAGGMLLLGLALVTEIVRRRNSRAHVLVVLDRFLPAAARSWAVALLAMLSTVGAFVGPQAASADTSVRQWLNDPALSTTPAAPNDSTAPSPVTAPPPPDGASIPTTPPDPRPAPVVHGAPSAPPPTGASSLPVRPASASSRTTSGRSAKSLPAPIVVAPPTPTPNPVPRYVVVAGDCLWSIAARLLGPGATNRAIDRGWRQIYDANRASVGENPSLIHPGLALTLPHLDNIP